MNTDKFEFTPTPIQEGILSTIQAFRLFPDLTGDGSYESIRQRKYLEFRLPRGEGATTLCMHLAQVYKCPIILRNPTAKRHFIDKYVHQYNEEPAAYCPQSLDRFCSFYNSSFKEEYNTFTTAVSQSKLIVFDVFRAFCDNSIIKKMILELGGCQFIMFQ